jgi:hypothetical protein
MRRLRGRRRLVAASLLALCAAFAWIAWGSQVLPPDSDTLAVRVASEAALRTLEFDAFPPSGYAGGPLSSPDADAMRNRVRTDLRRSFTAPLVARYEPAMLGFIDQIPVGGWDSGGDMSMDWGRAWILGNRAQIDFIEHVSLLRHDASQPDQPPAPIGGTRSVQMSLVREVGQWRVDDFEMDCLADCP